MKLKKLGKSLVLMTMIFTMLHVKTYAVGSTFNFNGNLPSYYNTEWLNNVYSNAKKTTSKGEVTFAFVTDTNLSHNSGYSPALLRNIKKQAKLDFVVNGGNFSYIDQTTIKNTTAISFFEKYRSSLNKDFDLFVNYTKSLTNNNIPSYYVKGNHDLVVEDNQLEREKGSTVNIPRGEEYNKVMNPVKKNNISCPNGTYYYSFDDTKNKIRYIVLDLNENVFVDRPISLGQVMWFCEKLSEIKDYKVVVFSNAPVSETLGGSNYKNNKCIQEVEEAYNNCKKGTVQIKENGGKVPYDFTNNTNTIIAHISGNTHRDNSVFVNNVLSISTTADYYTGNRGTGMWDRTKGTTTEQAFDLMTVDLKNNKLYATRIGAGKDREWNLPKVLNKIDISNCKISGVTTKYYNGNNITLNLTVSNGDIKLVEGTDYAVNYSNNKEEGIATVKIVGKGSYKGTVTRRFRIIKNANIDTNKEYYITSAFVNARAIEGKNTQGAKAVTTTLNCGALQKFKFIKNSDGTYYIQNVKSKQYLKVYAGKTGTAKTPICLYAKENNYSQKWFIGKNSNSTWTLYTNNGLAMQIGGEKNNTALMINTVNSNQTQQFRLKSTSDISAATIDTSNYYYIVSAFNNKKAIDVYGGQTANLTNVDIYDLNKTNAQKFKFVKNSDGTYTIINKGSNKALDVYGNKTSDKTNVEIYTSNNSTAQKWYIIKNKDNTITFLGVESGRAIDLNGGNTTNLTNIQIYNWNQKNSQKWNLIKE